MTINVEEYCEKLGWYLGYDTQLAQKAQPALAGRSQSRH